jgi:hypothetical protein
MGDLKTELQQKVVPVIPQWTEGGPDQPEEGTVMKNGHGEGLGVQAAPEPSITELVYLAVKNHPGKGSGFYTVLLKGKVSASSVSSLLRQLEHRGFLRHTGKPMLYYTTDQAYEVGNTAERRRLAIQRATITRSLNAKRRRDTAKRMTKPVEVPKAKKADKQDSPGVQMDPRDKPVEQPLPQSFPPTAMLSLPQTTQRMTPAQFVEAMDVRTARAVLNELKQLFGES